jgi:RNA polymerase sigma-70 factor (ECF subfamily)
MTTGPADSAALAAEFEAHRPRLMRLAYATTGSLAEAEDCVQEGWLRLQRAAQREPVRDLGAWLTTTVSRLALDALDRARVRREHHAGPWLPEPLIESLADPGDSPARPGADPADRVTLDESVSMALLIVLEALTPAERTVFLLHDVFGVSYEEITGVVGRSAAAVRQLASRARRHVREDRPRFPPTRAQQREVLDAFLRACAEGDLGRLVTLLDPEVVWRADGGPVRAQPKQARGAARIAALLLAFARRPPQRLRTALVNGAPGLVVRDADGILSVLTLTLDNGRITAIDVIRNPDKLAGAARLLAAGE